MNAELPKYVPESAEVRHEALRQLPQVREAVREVYLEALRLEDPDAVDFAMDELAALDRIEERRHQITRRLAAIEEAERLRRAGGPAAE